MTTIVILALLFMVSATGGVTVYRRTLGRGPFAGTSGQALRLASVLGAFLGVSVALATVLLVLALRDLR